MRVGILSFYYPPDLSAGSFRVGALVAALRELAPTGTELDVITTAPNRYHSFAREVPGLEHGEGLRVRR
ncbi:MAG TPA: hypothetical protein VGQ27_08070, partial [Steroidobacteraceae bacterium]|nr:hypothetical protein [Steroidobacteraceae bacterium]